MSHLCRNKIAIVSPAWRCNTIFHGWQITPFIGERYLSSCHERGTKRKLWVPRRNRTSDLWIQRSDALPLSHRLTWHERGEKRVGASQHGIRRSEVLFIMGTQRNLLCPTLLPRRKAPFSISLPSLNLPSFLLN